MFIVGMAENKKKEKSRSRQGTYFRHLPGPLICLSISYCIWIKFLSLTLEGSPCTLSGRGEGGISAMGEKGEGYGVLPRAPGGFMSTLSGLWNSPSSLSSCFL